MEGTPAAKETSLRRSKRGRPPKAREEDPSSKEKSAAKRVSRNGSPEQSGDGSEYGSDDFEGFGSRPRKKANSAGSSDKASEQSLIEIIKGDGKLIPRAVKQWVDRYEGNAEKAAIIELLTMLFEACGAKYQLNEASLDETSVDDVVLALVVLAKNGEINDCYTSKRKEFKNFKENLAEFWDNLVIECQNGPLFDQILFQKCMDYIIALSCTPPRVYRLVGSLVGLQLVTSLITVAKTLAAQRETTQRQLNTEKKRKTDGPRVESLNKRLSMTHEKITVTEEMMRKIFTGLFMHRYRDIDPDIRQMSIKALGVWIVSYPSMFLQDSYLKYLGWTLNDKNAAVRKTSVLALQNLYEVDDTVPSLGLFTERFCNRMIELADDIDNSVAVSAIGLLKQLLRHQLLADDELGPLYDLLIDEPPAIRRAIGELVYDHLIAQKFVGSESGSREDDETSEVHLARMLQILREFSTDPLLSAYVIDDIWDDMKAMRDWKCIISMLLDGNPSIELTDVDATSLVRLLNGSVKKAVGEKIIPAADNRKPHYTKAQKEALENSRQEITTALLKSYPQLLRKFMADKAKVPYLVDLILHLKLDLYSLKRQEQNFKTVLQSIKSAFFKHGERETLRACIKANTFCCTESQADLQDFAHTILKELESELTAKVKTAIKGVQAGDDEYSLLVNLKRMYELQLQKSVSFEDLYEDMAGILQNFNNIDYEVVAFLLLNMHFHVIWSFESIDIGNPSEGSVVSLLNKRATLFELLGNYLEALLEAKDRENNCHLLACRVITILAELWCLFKKSRFQSTKLDGLGFCPETAVLEKFWRLCELQLNISDDTEDEGVNEEYIEETNRDTVMIAAAKLVATDTIPKDFLGAEIISHFGMHGTSVAEIVKNLITVLRKNANDEIPDLFVEALKRAYQRHMEEATKSREDPLTSKSLLNCKDLATRLSGMFIGAARNKHKSQILEIIKNGISFSFEDAPKHLSFLDGAVLPFVSKLPTTDIIDILKDVEERSETFNTDEDPSGWRPYYTFVEKLREKYTINDNVQDDKEAHPAKRRRGPGRKRKVQGRKLFDGQGSSEEEDSISGSDQEDKDEEQEEGEQDEEEEEEEEDEEERPLIHSLKSSSSKLRLMRVSKQEKKVSASSAGSVKSP